MPNRLPRPAVVTVGKQRGCPRPRFRTQGSSPWVRVEELFGSKQSGCRAPDHAVSRGWSRIDLKLRHQPVVPAGVAHPPSPLPAWDTTFCFREVGSTHHEGEWVRAGCICHTHSTERRQEGKALSWLICAIDRRLQPFRRSMRVQSFATHPSEARSTVNQLGFARYRQDPAGTVRARATWPGDRGT